MIIPENVNFLDFYSKAKEKGINVQSRFKGVCVKKHNWGRDIGWRAQIGVSGKCFCSKIFPFTAEGEKRAASAYGQLLTKHKLNNH